MAVVVVVIVTYTMSQKTMMLMFYCHLATVQQFSELFHSRRHKEILYVLINGFSVMLKRVTTVPSKLET